MKNIILILALFPFTVSAQQYTGVNMDNQAEMKNMMEAMQKMQACMMKISKKEIKTLERKAKVFEKEMQALCKKGNRDQAQRKAASIFKNMMNDPISQKLKKCTGIFESTSSNFDVTETHICDSSKDDHNG